MFVDYYIQRRLATLLQPWLRDDQELDLKLGFFRSNGILNGVSLNTKALNELLDEPSKICFKEATVEHMSLQFSPFSSAAFTLVVRGLRVVFSLGEEEDEAGVKWRRKPRDTTVEERNKFLEEIDPEGSALHRAIKKISDIATGTWRSSLLNTVIKYCKLQLDDVHVLLQSLCLPDSFSCSLYMEKFGTGSPIIGRRTFIRGLMSSFFVPREEISFDVGINGFEITLNTGDRTSCIFPATDMSIFIKLNHLRHISFCFHVPELKFLFSPADLSVILLLSGLLSKEYKRARTGRQLWNIVATKICFLLPASNLLLSKVVRILCLWLRYTKTYQSMLLLVGYPEDKKMKRSATLMFHDATYSRSVRSQWKLISEIEKDLPLEAIAVGRRIIRCRLASSGPEKIGNFDELLATRPLSKTCQLLVFVWRWMATLLVALMRILFLHKVMLIFPESRPHFASVHENSLVEKSIIVNVGEISISVCPDNAALPSVSGKAVTDTNISSQDKLSFHCFVSAIFVRYVVNISKQCFTFASGCLEVNSFPTAKAGASSYLGEHQKKDVDKRQVVLWGENAQMIHFPEDTSDDATGGISGPSVSHLDCLLAKLWLNWKNYCLRPEGENIPNMQAPWILCELWSCVTAHRISDSSSASCSWFNCTLVVGKLNFNLENDSLMSAILLYRQIKCALYRTVSNRANVLFHPSAITIEGPAMRYWSSKLASCSSKIKTKIIRMLPEKHVQIGALIAGPHVQISLLNDQLYAETSNPHHLTQISFEICNIELLVSPNLEDCVGLSNVDTSECHRGPECIGLKELQEIDVPKSDYGAYTCQGQVSLNACLKFNGLQACLDEGIENQRPQIIVLRPTTAQLSCIRNYYHSFDSSVVAVSVASQWVVTDFSCLMFLDELCVLAKIMAGVVYELLAFTVDGSGGHLSYEAVSSRDTFHFASESGETLFGQTKQASLVTDPQVFLNCSCELRSFDVVLHLSRKNCSPGMNVSMMRAEKEIGRKLSMHDTYNNGIYISIQKSLMEFTLKGQTLDVVIDTTGVRCIIFRYLDEFDGNSDKSELKNILCSLNFLTEASVYHTKLCFCLRNFEKAVQLVSLHSTTEESGSCGITFHTWGESPLTVDTERLGDHWLSSKICISEVYIAGCQVKDILVNGIEKFNASFSVGGEFQAISCECKGGSLLLEAAAVMMLIECFSFYNQRISELWSSGQSSGSVTVAQHISEMASLPGHPSISPPQIQHGEVITDLEAFCMSVLHLTLVLVERDESGRLRKLIFEVDFRLSLELLNTVQKISISITRFSILSQFMHSDLGNKANVFQGPVLSVVPDDSLSNFTRKDPLLSLQHKDSVHLNLTDPSGPNSSVSQRDSHVDISINPGKKHLNISPQKYILKDLQCFLAVEGPVTRSQISAAYSNQIWIGSGSILGIDMTISLHEIKMALSAFESFSKILNREGTSKLESRHWSYNQEAGGSLEEMVPDGTIVAIHDVDQHMYIAVGGAQSGYDIAGAIHYSLVGERALFRVKYHKPRRWKSQVQYFYLISLYAKDNAGESLRLSCQQRSRFVDISCSNDSGSALWTVLPFKSDAYEDTIEPEPSTALCRRTFHLVNKKNGYPVAFIDGILEFVSKPGNLFKWKAFIDTIPLCYGLLPSRHIAERPSGPPTRPRELCASPNRGTNSLDPFVADMGELRTNGNIFGITVTVEKATLTIVHEISDTEEKFPLLQGSIMCNQTVLQILDSKVRVMNAFEVILYYFDAQQNSWRDLIHPVEIRTFYSQKFLIQGSENFSCVTASHFYARIKEVTVLLSELSLDILLFAIGKLDLAGPYSVKSSLVLANCCKVENQSGLTLICQFYDNQDVSISTRQSTTVFLRNLALANQPPEASFFSIQLVQQDFLSTSPIRVSLTESQQFAWRTPIVSLQDSKSFPGPLVVVEISKGIEDGLSINVSPLLKIHNETDFSLKLRFQRPQHQETESATLILNAGDVVDDAMTAFTATDLSGGSRKALTSLCVGNYVFSFRPNIADELKNFKMSSIEWSDDLKGGKPIHLSGLFDKLSYQVRKAFSVSPVNISLSSATCALKSQEGFVANIHFLIQTIGKAVPVVNPDKFGYTSANKSSPVAMPEQKEIFVLPTIRVSNLLHTEIHVSLTDRDPQSNALDCDNLWSQATISCGSAANFYVNPATIHFVVALTSFGLKCKPVNSSDWVRKLQKQKGDIPHLDIELEFSSGKYFAMLRLSRGPRGALEAGVFTSYALQNDTNVTLFCLSANQKPSSREEMDRFGTGIPPELGSYLPPNSITSWFLKCHKLCFKLLGEKELEAHLDLDVLSGLTEIDLESEELFGSKNIMRLGVSLKPALTKKVSSHLVSLNSRYIVCNESEDVIAIRQCYMEGMEELIALNSKQRTALRLNTVIPKKKETNVVENLLRKHAKSQNNSSFFIQFRPHGTRFGWSGPVCVASLGRFFLKFQKSSEFPESQSDSMSKDNLGEFAAVHALEEGSTIVLHFRRPPITNLPYRIENCLHDSPITYYQKGASSEPEILGAGVSVHYVWDDLTLPHKLVVQLDDVHLLREINLDKVRSWKPFYRKKQTRDPGFHLTLDKKPKDQKQTTYSQLIGSVTLKVGFEVYADGVTRVLRICEFSDSHKVNMVSGSSTKMRLRISSFSIHLLEHAKQEVVLEEPSDYAPIIITRLERVNWDAFSTDQHKYNQIRVQSLSVDERWVGAPFAAMLRGHQLEKSDANDCILHVAVILLPTSSFVKQVKYLSIVLQPLDLNLDEETLMKIVPFWRRSLSDSSTPRQQYYFDHFEIHPIKIVASFLPGDSHHRYSSTQETLRSLLHSVIKIPVIKRKTVELNGVLVTHALITLRELSIKCAQHYSWYAMRAIYIAKGSPLLPPAFVSIFDDLASSSLDVFFDPSSGLLNLPGVTLGTLKLISKFIDKKGFSGTKRYFGDMGKTLKTAGSNMLFAAVTEISDSVLKGAETSGFNGMVNGFHQGILKLAMEPSVLGSAFMEGGPDRKIKLDRSPGVDELYIEGYLQAMLDTMYKQEYLRVRVIEDQVVLKSLPPSSSLIDEIMEQVKDFLASKALLKGEPSTSHSLRPPRGEREWRIGPTILTLCEHLFVSFVIRLLRKQSGKVVSRIKWKEKAKADEDKAFGPGEEQQQKVVKVVWKWGIGKFVLSGIVAYIDGRLCRTIPNPLARRIVSGFLLSFLDQSDDEKK